MPGVVLVWSLIGFCAAWAIKLIWRLEELPVRWVAWSAYVGAILTIIWFDPSGPG